MRVRVVDTIADLERDMKGVIRKAKIELPRVVAKNAKEGNRLAQDFASEQHTMFGDTDADYPPSFTAEKRGKLIWEYGPDSAIGDGSKSPGFEHGSRNSPPHHDLARSADIQGLEFSMDVSDAPRDWFW